MQGASAAAAPVDKVTPPDSWRFDVVGSDLPRVTARTPETFSQQVQVETPEQVVFSYSIAGVGSRAAAALIDYILCLAPGGLLATFLTPLLSRGPDGQPRSELGVWVMAFLVLAQFATLWGYYVFFEGLFDGQTPGKRYMRLRVVQDGGYSVSFAASAVRNLARIIDMQPFFFYIVGIASVAISRSGKRLGDIAAGTLVVEERTAHLIPAAAATPLTEDGAVPMAELSEDEYALLERFVARRHTVEPGRLQLLADRLVERFAAQLLSVEGNVSLDRLVALYERERAARAVGAASRTDTGARREQHALVAGGTARWQAFADRLRVAQKVGLARLPEDEVSRFAADYRELSTDLARLQTAARGREVDAVFYLSRLVAGGHNLLYGRRRVATGTVWRYLTVTIPREVRRSGAVIALAACVLFIPWTVAHLTLQRNPELARDMLPAGMIDRAETARVRAERGEGYIDIPEIMRPAAASGIIANNVQITFTAFIFGITAGVGTALLLLYNGVVLGGFFGFYASTGQGLQLLAFVAPHGVLELSAIVLGGAAGFHLAAGILLPGALTRREALVARGRRAANVIACATMMLIIAGSIEGMISPRRWPLEWKLAVAAVTALMLAFYLTRGRGDEEDIEEERFAYSDARALISR